jgi:2-polyprenyl-3-methyl-5-hydroxy-6-metoxy-1,4-benzoquinol methylase
MTDLFEEKAKNWDANEHRKKMSLAIGGSILHNVSLNDKMHVMDFGAGTGLIASQIAPHVEKVTAVDVSEAMLNKLMSKIELKGKVEVCCQDITLNPLGFQCDLIVSAMAMHHVEDTENLVLQFSKHLKPGGGVALADLDAEDGGFHNPPSEGVFHNGFERELLGNIFKRNGFTNVRFVTAHTAIRENGEYPIFLLLADKT